MRLATRPANGALISVRASCWFAIDVSARAWASAASATCWFTSAARRSLSVMPPVFRRLSARSFSTRAWAWFASATARDARDRSAFRRKSVGSRTARTSPWAARAPSSRRIWRRRAATSATTCTWARGLRVPVRTTSSWRSRCSTVTVRTGTPRGFASGAVRAVPSQPAAARAASAIPNRFLRVIRFLPLSGPAGRPMWRCRGDHGPSRSAARPGRWRGRAAPPGAGSRPG